MSVASNEDVIGVGEIRWDEVWLTTVSRGRNGSQSLDFLPEACEDLRGVGSFRRRDEVAGDDERVAVDELGR